MINLLAINIAGFELFFTVIIFAFICELVDSSLGMGYGTALTPTLLLIGFESAVAIVPAVLLSELFTGIAASLAHHKEGNVNFKKGSTHLKIALVLGFCSIIGATSAVFIALSIPNLWLKTYIGVMVIAMGLIIIATLHKNYAFSWKKIIGLGAIASFNKGMSGGGYGPVVTGGQLLSGVNGKNAVGITSLAEGLTSLVGVIIFLAAPFFMSQTDTTIYWPLATSMIIGAMLSVPFSTKIVKRINTQTLKLAIGLLTTGLGIFTLTKLFLL